MNLLALLFLTHAGMSRAREHTTKFFSLSYYNQKTGEYGIGSNDNYLILFCVVLFTGLRAATMDYVLSPLARSQGMTKKKDITRFSEQAWLLVYYSFFWSLGLVCSAPDSPSVDLLRDPELTLLCSTFIRSRPTTSTYTSFGRTGRTANLAGL